MNKRCEMCGADISTPDYFEQIRRKYCKVCAADVHRRQKAEWARELRRKTRERNALTRELCKTQAEEIDALRALVIRQREQLRKMEVKAYD